MAGNKNRVYIGLALFGAAVYFLFLKGKSAVAAVGGSGAEQVASVDAVASAVTGAISGRITPEEANTVVNPVPVVQYAFNPGVMSWAKSALTASNWARFQAVDGTFTAADWLGLYRLVNADPGFGFGTPGGGVFWDRWRVQYHIDDGTY